MSNYILITKRLGLRRWENKDSQPFSIMNEDREVMKFFPDIMTHQQTQEMIERINAHFEEHGFGLYAVDKLENQEFIGFIGFSHPNFESEFTPCIEIGWRIRKEDWNFGYATEGAKACLKYGFSVLNFQEVYSYTAVVNLKSERVMQKIGMEKIGEFKHPQIHQKHPLSNHVLYRKSKALK